MGITGRSPPLGNLRTMLSHHRVLAYRSNRDRIRGDRGAPPIWLDTHQSVGPAAWVHRSQPLRQRVQALRSLWDLQWHGENRAVAARSVDPQVSTCPICHRHWTQAHDSATVPVPRAHALQATWTSLSPSVTSHWTLCLSWAANSKAFSSYPTSHPS